MSRSLAVLIPHQLGKPEAIRRKSGLAGVQQNLSWLLAVQEEGWAEDQLRFRVSALGQVASGNDRRQRRSRPIGCDASLADGSAGRQDTTGDPRTGEEGPERARQREFMNDLG
jgi:hypothetical protein